MFKSLEILFTNDGFCISEIGESVIECNEYLLITLICKPRKVIKIKVLYFNVNGKKFEFEYNDKYLINASGLNFISLLREPKNYINDDDLDGQSIDNVSESLYNALYNYFSYAQDDDINKLKNYFGSYMSVGDSKVKNFVEFKNKKLVSQNEMCMLMSIYLIQMACHIVYILMLENSVFSEYFGLLDFNVEKVMYNVCKNTLQDSEYALRPNLISSQGLMDNYFHFCLFYITFWKNKMLDGPDSNIMKINIITGCTNYIIYNNQLIKNQQEFMLSKIQREYEKLKQLQDNVCFNKREIRKTVENILNSRNY